MFTLKQFNLSGFRIITVKKSAVVENKLAAKTLRDKLYTFDDFPPFFK